MEITLAVLGDLGRYPIELYRMMQFRLSSLLWAVFVVSLVFATVRHMPMVALSAFLLLPFLATLVAIRFLGVAKSLRVSHPWAIRSFLATTFLLFYVGMTGPLWAIDAMRDSYPAFSAIPGFGSFFHYLYLPFSLLPNEGMLYDLQGRYVFWWLKLMQVLIEF